MFKIAFASLQVFIILGCSTITAQNSKIFPGEIWNDTQGNPINAHSGGILFHNGTYFIYETNDILE